MIVDSIWSFIGSANWDPRSLRLNFEFNLECYGLALAASLGQVVQDKLRVAERVTMDDINGRSLPIKLRDGAARLLSPYL
jgi:cardiolipin synthase